MDAKNYKILSPKKYDIRKILKIHEKLLLNPRTYFLLFYIVQGKMRTKSGRFKI